ncbi:MAG: FAD-binding protein, partial [Clostridia bacterium]|nr:FAD-binding protein [Clostridia bacterium]
PAGGIPDMGEVELLNEDYILQSVDGANLSYVDAEEGYFKLYESFLEKGGRALLETTAHSLIYDDDGNISGVTAISDDGTTYTVYAKAVVLATGGFGGNEEMVEKYTPGGSAWIYYGWQNNDGDGINMAFDAGAAPMHMDAYPMSHQRMGAEFITCFDVQQTNDGQIWSPNDLTVVLSVNQDGVYLTKDGKPFRTEDIRSKMGGFSGSMGSYYLGSTYYAVYSATQLRLYESQGISDTTMGFQNVGEGIPDNTPLGDWVDTVLEYAASRGWAWKVNSLSEGNYVLNLPEGTLEAAYAADATSLNAIGDEYYYIIEGTGLSISSCGGILVNEKMQAVRNDESVLENLFIAGNDSFGNIMATGAEYSIGGDAGMWCFGSGYIAGIEAVNVAKG